MKKNTKTIAILTLVVVIATCAIMLTSCDLKLERDHFEEDAYYTVDFSRLKVMNFDISQYSDLLFLALDLDNSYFVFHPDGTLHGQIKTQNGILGMLSGFGIDLGSTLAAFDIESGLQQYVEPMFPGFTDCLRNADLKGALMLAKKSLGLNIEGIDYNDEGVKSILKYVAENMKLPETLFDDLPQDTYLEITLDTRYTIKNVTGSDGTEYRAIYLGNNVSSRTSQTNPFITFTEQEDGALNLIIEFMNIDATLIPSGYEAEEVTE